MNETNLKSVAQRSMRAVCAALLFVSFTPAAGIASAEPAILAPQPAGAEGEDVAAPPLDDESGNGGDVEPGAGEGGTEPGDVQRGVGKDSGKKAGGKKKAVAAKRYVEKAKKRGSWKYRTVKRDGKKVKVKKAYRYKDGTYPARITKIGKQVYYFKNFKGKLGVSAKSQRVIKLKGKLYCVASGGTVRRGWWITGKSLRYFGGPFRSAVVNGKVDGIRLSAGGRAVMTLDAALKYQCIKTLDRITHRSASKSEKLMAIWKYMTGRTFHYRMLYFNPRDKAWAKRYAYEMLLVHRGNCYGFAACFAALAEEIGCKTYVVTGRVPGTRDGAWDGFTRHGVAKVDGRWFDPEGQFAGWARGVYNVKHYWVRFISRKYKRFSSFDGSGDPRGLSSSVRASRSLRVVKKKDGYRGYLNSKRVAGLYCVKGKLYRFSRKHDMSVAAKRRMNAAAERKKPWKRLRKILGKPKSHTSAKSCYGVGRDHVYKYAHVEICTFKPKGGREVVMSCDPL